MADGNWSVARAKAKFSEVVEKARVEGPQHITRNGKDAVVVVAAAEWARCSRRSPSFTEVLLDPSIRGILRPGEEKLFERDRTGDRSPPDF